MGKTRRLYRLRPTSGPADRNQVDRSSSAITINQHFSPGLPNFNGSHQQNQLAVDLQSRHDTGEATTGRARPQYRTRLLRVVSVPKRPCLRSQNHVGSVHCQMVRKQRRNRVFPRRYASWHRFYPRRSRLQSGLKLPRANRPSGVELARRRELYFNENGQTANKAQAEVTNSIFLADNSPVLIAKRIFLCTILASLSERFSKVSDRCNKSEKLS